MTTFKKVLAILAIILAGFGIPVAMLGTASRGGLDYA